MSGRKRKSLREFTYGVNEEKLNALLTDDDVGFVKAVADMYEKMSVTDIESLVKILRYVESLDELVALYDVICINHKKVLLRLKCKVLLEE